MSEPRTWDSVFVEPGDPGDSGGPGGSGGSGDGGVGRPVRKRRRRRIREKRRDIQGLRMVAVVAVVINHLTGHPQGGFVGVDVFFVISGYLITGHLLREHVKSGTISLLDFYRRRIRRLFPAALTVTVATVLAAYLVFTEQRFHNTVTDGVWATLFGANWRLININTDYFAAGGPVSPLQHYWSLSVEEQFYVVWPLVMLCALLAVRRVAARRAGARSAAAWFAGAVLTGGSFVVAVAQSSSDPVVAYFSTFTRGWELGLGALLAVLSQTQPLRRVSSRSLTTTTSWLGLLLILVSLFVVNANHFPFPGGLLPCLGSALVIIAWSELAPAKNFVLTNRLSNYLGDISYSIYVVHFPVIIFAGVLVTQTSAATDTAVLLLVLCLSMLLFHLIEDPIRRSSWLKPKRERGSYVTSRRLTGRLVLIGVTSGVCSLAIFALLSTAETGQYNNIVAALQAETPTASTGTEGPSDAALAKVTVKDADGPVVTAQAAKIKSALLADSWPSLSPPLGKDVPSETRGCGLALKPADECTWGNSHAKKVIYLVGDSTSEAYTLAFASMVTELPDWRVRSAGGSGCPFADRVLKDGPHRPGCGNRNDKLLAEIKAVHPDIVVSTSGVTNVTGSNSGSILAELDKIKSSVGTIVMLPPNPMGPDPNTCYTKFSKPADCVGNVDSDYRAWLVRNEQMAEHLHGIAIDPTAWYCLNGFCPVFVGNVPARRDQVHITVSYAKTLGPLILESFEQGDLLGSGSGTSDSAVEDVIAPEIATFYKQLKSALLAQSWPSLSPHLGEVEPPMNRGCGLELKSAKKCTWGESSAPKVIYLVGDSTSDMYTQAFAAMIKYLPGWRVRSAGGAGCPFADKVLKEEGLHSAGCGKRNDDIVAEIKSVRPDIVVSSSSVRNDSTSKWPSILAELDKINGSVGEIVMLPPNPILPDPNTCYTKFGKPADCVGQVDSDYEDWLARNEAMAKHLHGTFIDPTSWYCLDGYCPAFVGTVPMRKDSIHITDQYAQLLGPLVLDSFLKAKLLG